MTETLRSGNVTTKLQRIAELARKHRKRVFSSVAHAIDLEWVREAYRRTRKDGASGVDGRDATDFAKHLEQNLSDLADQLRMLTALQKRGNPAPGNGYEGRFSRLRVADLVAARSLASLSRKVASVPPALGPSSVQTGTSWRPLELSARDPDLLLPLNPGALGTAVPLPVIAPPAQQNLPPTRRPGTVEHPERLVDHGA